RSRRVTKSSISPPPTWTFHVTTTRQEGQDGREGLEKSEGPSGRDRKYAGPIVAHQRGIAARLRASDGGTQATAASPTTCRHVCDGGSRTSGGSGAQLASASISIATAARMKCNHEDTKPRRKKRIDLLRVFVASWLPLGTGLFDHTNLEIALFAQHGDADVERMLLEQQVDAAEWQREAEQTQVGEKRRQDGAIDRHAAAFGVNRHAQAGLNEVEHDAGRPCLRRTGDRVERRTVAGAPMEAAEQLRQPMPVHGDAGIEEARKRRGDE